MSLMQAPKILYEDAELLVVDKPAGMIVYPDGKHDYPALSHWLEKKYGEGGYHFVHRIDRETSGVLVVARTEAVYEFLKAQFAEREIKKTYRAFVHGVLKVDRGVIDKPIGSSRGGKGPRSAKLPHGTMREAVTAYRVIERSSSGSGVNDPATYVEAFPKTGRTHQIRVHFSAVQHPIIADQLYAPSRPKLLGFERLALHALSITFTHPNGKEMTFTAPLPADFLKAEKELRK
ncbi:MAG TPA: RluA family pseudouridine synthase [Candidatus Paceibacterota bacterium]